MSILFIQIREKHLKKHPELKGTIWCEYCNKTYKDNAKKKMVVKDIARRQKVARIKMSKGCEWEGGCEYKITNHRQLELDHIDPTLKLAAVSTMLQRTKKYPWEIVEQDIAKCRVLCKMHHAISTTTTRKRGHLVAV
jgi:hypothetical protein